MDCAPGIFSVARTACRLCRQLRCRSRRGRAAAEQWLADWLQVKPESLRSLPAEVTSDVRFQRGRNSGGLADSAKAKPNFKRCAKPTATLRRAVSAGRVLSRHRPVLSVDRRRRQPDRQSPAGSIENAPPFLQRLVYPIYYAI